MLKMESYKNYDAFTDDHLREMSFYMKFCARDTNFYMNFHCHQGYEIYFFHEGSGNFLIGDNLFPLEGNDLLLISALESHKSAPNVEMPFMRTVINFMPELLDEQERKMYLRLFKSQDETRHRHLRITAEKQEELYSVLERLYQEYIKRSFGYELAIRAYLKQLLLAIYRMVFSDSFHELKPISSQMIPAKIEEIIKYITQHFMEDISLGELSNQFFINPYYLCHIFKKTTGTTVNEFHIQTRIHYAKLYLMNSTLPISEISTRVGFNSPSYFGHVFKRYEEMTPNHYRRQMKAILR
ncbi:MAG: hypothetical protein JWN30_2083 [Bacilli bacterium]|nr:hypothetical protein [Bacilli bacterium]